MKEYLTPEGRREYHRRYRAKITPQERSAKYRARGEKNKEYSRRAFALDPLRNIRNNLKKNFGLSLEAYDVMLAKQQGLCGICKQPEIALSPRTKKIKRLAVDHSHKTGKIRALLCCRCNTAVGLMREDKVLLTSAIEYLEEHK